MPQGSLDFGRLYRVADAARALYRATNDAVDAVGIVPAAGACGIDRGDLRRSLDRDGRRVAVEHALSIAAVAPFDMRQRIADAFVSPLGFALQVEAQMTPEEKALRLEGALRALGPLGEQAMRAALGQL